MTRAGDFRDRVEVEELLNGEWLAQGYAWGQMEVTNDGEGGREYRFTTRRLAGGVLLRAFGSGTLGERWRVVWHDGTSNTTHLLEVTSALPQGRRREEVVLTMQEFTGDE